MAAAILRHKLAALGLADQIRVESAGVWAAEGQPASANAVAALAEQGIELAEHRSQAVSPALLARADLVLVMEEAHRRSLFHLAPQHLGKVYLLTEMAGLHEDVADPYGGTPEEYRRTVRQLEALIEAGLPRILTRLGLSESPESRARPRAAGANVA